MTKFIFSLIIILFSVISLCSQCPAGSTQIAIETFDNTDNLTPATGSSFFNDGTSDHFGVTDGSDISGTVNDFTGSFFAAEDVDDNGGTGNLPQTFSMEFNVAGYTSLSFSGDFLQPEVGGFDDADDVKVYASIDGSSQEVIIDVEEVDDGDASNQPAQINGTPLTTTSQTFTSAISGTGNTLTITVEVSLNSGGETIAFDNFIICGVSSSSSTCAVNLGSASYVCGANTSGSDAVTINIPYTGMDNSITSVSTTSSGTVGGDNPASVSNGTITITGLSEGDAWDISLNDTNGGDCDGTTLSGTVPADECPGVISCPDLLAAMPNACGTSEGVNEFIVFTTVSSAPVSAYEFQYGTTPSTSTNYLKGSDAVAPSSTTPTASCSVVHVTTASTTIPADRNVVFIPSNYNFDDYDFSSYCLNNEVYVVYINTGLGTNSDWVDTGTMKNSGGSTGGNTRYLRLVADGSDCDLHTYIPNDQLDYNGSGDGSTVTWDAAGNPTYQNNGCENPTTEQPSPVRLTSFSGSYVEEGVLLKWQTSMEVNNQQFNIMRSVDGKNFKKIGIVQGHGTTLSITDYSYIDYESRPGWNYYQLEQIDYDGDSEKHNIIAVEGKTGHFELIHASSDRISLYSPEGASVNHRIIGLDGRFISEKSQNLKEGINEIYFNEELQTGIHILQVENGAFIKNIKFMVF